MTKSSGKEFRVHGILQRYVFIHDQVFKPSIRKTVRVPGFFKAIDFRKHFEDLGILLNELEDATISNDPGDQEPVFVEYVTALCRSIRALHALCGKLFGKSEGTDYSMEEYNSDVAAYQDLVAEYRAVGSKLNKQLSNNGVIGGMMARPAKSWMLINHCVHLIAGLLSPDTFTWTTKGMVAAGLVSAVTQVIDQFRVYRHYQNEFKLIDQVHEIKDGRSISFEIHTILRHAQMLIVKVIWYALVTMIASGFRR